MRSIFRKRSTELNRGLDSRRRFRLTINHLEDRTVPSTITWDGGPTGMGTQWLEAVNWVGDVLPGPNDDAVIAAAGTGQPTTLILGGNTSVHSANVSRTLQVTGGALTIGNGISTFTYLELTGGTLTPQNGAQITGSHIDVFPGVIEIPDNVATTITATTINGDISNEGTLTGSFEQYGSVTNAGGAKFVAQGVQLVTGNVSNAGTIIIDGGLKVGRYLGPPYLVYYLGQIDNSAGGVINAHGEVWGNFTNAGVINIDSGLGWTGVSWLTGGGAGGFSVNSGTINVTDGDLFLAATDERSNLITFHNTGTLNIAAERTFTDTSRFVNYSLSGSVGTLHDGIFNIAGTMIISGYWSLFFYPVRITTLASNLTLDGSQSAIVDYHGLELNPIQLKEITSAGTLTLKNGRTLSTFASPTVFNVDGVLAVGAGCTLTSVEPLVSNGHSGMATGAGTIAGNVYLPRISPGDDGGIGRLNVTSIHGNTNYVFAFDITGTVAGTQYDQIRTTGALLSQSRLKVFLGYEPQPGDTYKIIDRDNALGLPTDAFAGLQEGASFVINGHRLRASYLGGDGNDVTLTVVAPNAPAPAVTAIDVGGGSIQRSRITQLKVTFDQIVSFNAGPNTIFRLEKIVGGVPNGNVQIFVTPSTVGDHTEAVVSFLSDTTSGSLNDGRYRLTIVGQYVFGGGVPMAADYVYNFHRLFGDANGDARIDIADYGLLSTSYNKGLGDPGYLAYFD